MNSMCVYTNFRRQSIIVTGAIVDVAWHIRGWSTVETSISQWHWNTRSITDRYVEVGQTTAALKVLSLKTQNYIKGLSLGLRPVSLAIVIRRMWRNNVTYTETSRLSVDIRSFINYNNMTMRPIKEAAATLCGPHVCVTAIQFPLCPYNLNRKIH